MTRRILSSSVPHRSLIAAGVAAVTFGAWLAAAPIASAAFPGQNGDIAFVSTRNNAVAVYQVNPNAANLGTVAGDEAATTTLTDGGLSGDDAEPFYSADGTMVYFSSNRSGDWVIYSIPQTGQEPATTPAELSQVSGSENHDDYAPTVSPNGKYVVFNRDNTALYTLDTTAANVPASVCLLYTPPNGLKASSDNGSDSRPVFDPADPSKLVYADSNGHLHLLSGLATNSEPCAANSNLTDTDLSAAATVPAGSPASWTSNYSDQDPDWNPGGTGIVFDSTRGGGHQIWKMDLSALPAVQITPLWAGQVGGPNSATQPVYSPNGNGIAFTQPVTHAGVQVQDYFVTNSIGGPQYPLNVATDLTLTMGIPQNSQPDWQPLPGPVVPESPYPVLLPGVGLLAGGIVLLLRRRRLDQANV